MKVKVVSKYNAKGQLYYDPPRCYWCGGRSITASSSVVQPHLHSNCGGCAEQEYEACLGGRSVRQYMAEMPMDVRKSGKFKLRQVPVRIGRKIVLVNKEIAT